MNLHFISAIPGGWLTIAIAILVIAVLPRLKFWLRPQRRVKQPAAWEKYREVDRSQWGKDQWEE